MSVYSKQNGQWVEVGGASIPETTVSNEVTEAGLVTTVNGVSSEPVKLGGGAKLIDYPDGFAMHDYINDVLNLEIGDIIYFNLISFEYKEVHKFMGICNNKTSTQIGFAGAGTYYSSQTQNRMCHSIAIFKSLDMSANFILADGKDESVSGKIYNNTNSQHAFIMKMR